MANSDLTPAKVADNTQRNPPLTPCCIDRWGIVKCFCIVTDDDIVSASIKDNNGIDGITNKTCSLKATICAFRPVNSVGADLTGASLI